VTPQLQLLKRCYDLLPTQMDANLDGQTQACVYVQYGERPKARTIDQLIGDKIKRPGMIRRRREHPGLTLHGCEPSKP
jgi:hypothetical protein